MARPKKLDNSNTAVITPDTHLTETEFSDHLKAAMMRYAFSVMEDRALPDARDGLKPSQRRILVAMNDLHLNFTGKTKKCAKICGDTSGNYHPHGEQVVYPTLVRMAQPWSLRYPLLASQGNFGSMGGEDPAAAMRYTEAKLSRCGEAMLADIGKEVVHYRPNYDESLVEPEVLPSMLPNLLVNGSSGIAVGVATNIPPHNLREVSAVIRAFIDNPSLTVDEVMALMPGPDFPTGGVLRGQEGVRSYYATGRGSVQVDGVYEILEGNRGTSKIRITELPYNGSGGRLQEQIAQLVEAKKIEGITDARDLGRKEVNVVVEVGQKGNVDLIVNQLLKHTMLRQSFPVNQTVFVEGEGVVENAPILKLVEIFVNHRKQVLTNKFAVELKERNARLHIVEGLLYIIPVIKTVIELITEADSPEDAAFQLVDQGFVRSEIQAQAVLAITLSRLTKLQADALRDEEKKLKDRITWLEAILASEKKLLRYISKEQEELAEKYGDERRTAIGSSMDDIDNEDLIPREKCIISITKDGYIKRLPVDTYRTQRRGGKGVTSGKLRDEDEAADMFVADSHDFVLFFTTSGLMYRKKGYQIPEGSRTGKGVHMANLLSLNEGEHVTNTISVPSLDIDGYLLMITRNGLIKRSAIRDYNTKFKNRGLQAIKLNEGDQVAFVEVTDGRRDIFLVTSHGKGVRYPENPNVLPKGRVTEGVRAIKLQPGDSIAKMITLSPDEDPYILLVTEKGFGKRTQSAEYRTYSGRGGVGCDVINTKTDRNGVIVGAAAVTDEDNLIILTNKGKIVKTPVSTIRVTGRKTMGVKVIDLDDNDTVVTVDTVKKDLEEFSEEE